MNSCLYECKVMHYRTEPKTYRMDHKIFMFALDLDEVDALARKSKLFGHRQKRIFNFCDEDHMSFGKATLKENVIEYVRQNGVQTDIKRVTLVTNVRTFGYVFNPVCFYYCFDAENQPICAIAQVGNTFGELKAFFLGPETLQNGFFRSEQIKNYYISPFIKLDVPMDFQLWIPGERLMTRVDDLKDHKKFLYATMTGTRKEFTDLNLLWYGIKFPFVTLKVIFLIHYHAAVLAYIKKIPHHKKDDNPHLQKEVQRAYVKH